MLGYFCKQNEQPERVLPRGIQDHESSGSRTPGVKQGTVRKVSEHPQYFSIIIEQISNVPCKSYGLV